MGTSPSLWTVFADASVLVKCVMFLLLAISVVSWTFIFQRSVFLKKARAEANQFESEFWSGTDLGKLYNQLNTQDENDLTGLSSIFKSGFKEFIRLRKQPGITPAAVIEGVQRSMRIAQAHENEKLQQHLNFLATVGSTSPYVGLFGTVWGIMTAFRALGAVQQASISMVAPGISEALITTAMGLFAAIPAVIAYNFYASRVERISNQYDTFQEELSSILYRQVHLTLAKEKELS